MTRFLFELLDIPSEVGMAAAGQAGEVMSAAVLEVSLAEDARYIRDAVFDLVGLGA